MNACSKVVIYDQWAYMTMLGIREVVYAGVPEEKQIGPASLGPADTQFLYAGAKRAAVEPKDFCSPVFAAHLPIGLLKYPDNVVTFNHFQSFLRGR